MRTAGYCSSHSVSNNYVLEGYSVYFTPTPHSSMEIKRDENVLKRGTGETFLSVITTWSFLARVARTVQMREVKEMDRTRCRRHR